MKVSVITVVYNNVDMIRDCVRSVREQDYPDVEYIVIDGASTDGTIEVLHELKGQINVLISEPDKGIYDAMNKGLERASGDVIAILNSDDFFASNHTLSRVVERMSTEKVDCVYGDVEYVLRDEPEKTVRKWRAGHPGRFKRGWHPPHQGFYMSRTGYEKVGVFSTDYKIAADFELLLKVFELHKLSSSYLQETVVFARMGGVSTLSGSNYLLGFKEIKRAFRSNKVHFPVFYPIYRYGPKIIAYLKGLIGL